MSISNQLAIQALYDSQIRASKSTAELKDEEIAKLKKKVKRHKREKLLNDAEQSKK